MRGSVSQGLPDTHYNFSEFMLLLLYYIQGKFYVALAISCKIMRITTKLRDELHENCDYNCTQYCKSCNKVNMAK